MSPASSAGVRRQQRTLCIKFRLPLATVCISAAVFASTLAVAGPPFLTDDPEPTPTGQFENYLFVEGTRADGIFGSSAIGGEINYGAYADTQLTFSFPFNPNPGPGGYGLVWAPLGGGVKYRFIGEDDTGWRPQVAVFPQVSIPVGSSERGQPVTWLFPLWAQKSFGDFTAFGGGGMTVNPGAGNRNYASWGIGLLDQLTKDFGLGPEVFGISRPSVANAGSAAVGLGAIYDLDDTWHLVGSGNTAVANRREDIFSFNFALKWTH